MDGHSWAPKAVDESIGDPEIHAGVEAYFASLPEKEVELASEDGEDTLEGLVPWLESEREKSRRVVRGDIKAFLNQNPPVNSGRTVAKIFQVPNLEILNMKGGFDCL